MDVLGSTQLDENSTVSLPLFVQLLIFGIELLGPILYSWNQLDSQIQEPLDEIIEDFDFIVVGGGSGGSVVANRLSESFRVLLLEAGGIPHPILRIPVLTYTLHGLDAVDWKWRTIPQKNASLGLKNQVAFWPAGKGLGGSSNINGMIDIRGSVQGFDILANLTGDSQWKMQNMLRIYKGLEDYHGYFDDVDGEHGKGGTLPIEKSHLHPVTVAYLKAGEEVGYRIRDPNAFGPVTDGFAPMDFYTKNGRRWSAYHSYLQPIMGTRESLNVQKYATATKILFSDDNKAVGVEYLQNGRLHRARVTKEVILSAGALQSPKLLMLSGIGPKAHLQEHGIKVRMDLPVGQNLQDKYGALVGPFISEAGSSFLSERDLNLRVFQTWQSSGKGAVSCSRVEATSTFASSIAKKNGYSNFPDLHTYFFAWSIDARYDRTMGQAFNINDEIMYKYLRRARGQDSFLQIVTLNQPWGSGELKLSDRDPLSHPVINPKYLEDERDVAVLVEGVKRAVDLVEKTRSFKSLNASLLPFPIPGCEHLSFKSDTYWECLARHFTITAYKYSATAPMGKHPSTDPKAVVDSKLRVFGVKGLRVVDASVLQTRIVSVNHVTVQAVAELASKFILRSWQ